MRPVPFRKAIRSRDDAEVGVGTLIIFIAMVLVAAVAAAVIIGTSGSLQQRAQATGKEATEEVSSNLMIVDATGFRNDSVSGVYTIKLYIMPSAGAKPMDLSQMVMRFSDGTNTRIYRHADSPGFTLTWVRGEGFDDVIHTGDLVELSFNMQNDELDPREEFDLQLLPAVGSPIEIDMKMPATYGDATIVAIG